MIGTLFGGSAFKILEHFLSKKQIIDNTAVSMRTELRTEIDRHIKEIEHKETRVSYYREELSKAEEENDRIRESYYKLREEFYEARRLLQQELDILKLEALKEKDEDGSN